MKRPVRQMSETTAMVVAPQPEAVEAGSDILRAGGNAVDAAIATALVQGVVDPLMCGIGGFGMLQVHDPDTKTNLVLDGMGRCPGGASETMWQDKLIGETKDGFGFILDNFVNEAGASSVTTPGILRTLATAHSQYGVLPWNDLFGMAIDTARSGWIIRPHVYAVFTQNERRYGRMNYGEKLGLTRDGQRLYHNSDGTYKRIGDSVVNNDLAHTLTTLSTDKGESLYTGSLADHVAQEIKSNGGLLDKEDLSGFQGLQTPPLQISYHGVQVSVPDSPGGGVYIAQALRILENFDLPALGHNSAEYIRVLAEVMKVALRDKEEFIGDPEFSSLPYKKLLAADNAYQNAERIRAREKTHIERMPSYESQHTTHVSTIDKNGMMVSLTHTLGNPSGFIAKDTGFILNGGMSAFDPRPGRPNSIAPGKRRYSSIAPTLLFSGNDPVATLGAPGAAWIGPALVQFIVNVVVWGMGTQEAVEAPRIAATSDAVDISNRIPRSIERQLESMGYEVRRSPLSYAFAGVHAITKFDGLVHGGADPQRDGYAQGI